jgi:hypothetical protein
MEFGALIPLYYMMLCCLLGTPVIGIAILIYIRFYLRDLVLAKYILATVLIICLIWFLFPFGQLIYGAISVCQNCPDSDFRITKELIVSVFKYAANLALLQGTASGFLFAFLIVTPTVFIVRKIRKGNLKEG